MDSEDILEANNKLIREKQGVIFNVYSHDVRLVGCTMNKKGLVMHYEFPVYSGDIYGSGSSVGVLVYVLAAALRKRDIKEQTKKYRWPKCSGTDVLQYKNIDGNCCSLRGRKSSPATKAELAGEKTTNILTDAVKKVKEVLNFEQVHPDNFGISKIPESYINGTLELRKERQYPSIYELIVDYKYPPLVHADYDDMILSLEEQGAVPYNARRGEPGRKEIPVPTATVSRKRASSSGTRKPSKKIKTSNVEKKDTRYITESYNSSIPLVSQEFVSTTVVQEYCHMNISIPWKELALCSNYFYIPGTKEEKLFLGILPDGFWKDEKTAEVKPVNEQEIVTNVEKSTTSRAPTPNYDSCTESDTDSTCEDDEYGLRLQLADRMWKMESTFTKIENAKEDSGELKYISEMLYGIRDNICGTRNTVSMVYNYLHDQCNLITDIQVRNRKKILMEKAHDCVMTTLNSRNNQ